MDIPTMGMSEPTTAAGRALLSELISDGYNADLTLPLVLAIEAEARAADPHTRLVIVSENLFDLIGTRTEDGDRLSYEWGEPDERGWYTPIVTRHHDDNLRAAALDEARAAVDKLAAREQEIARLTGRTIDSVLRVSGMSMALAAIDALREGADKP